MMTNSPEVRNSLLYMILYSQHNPDEMYGNEFASYENNDFHWFFFYVCNCNEIKWFVKIK